MKLPSRMAISVKMNKGPKHIDVAAVVITGSHVPWVLLCPFLGIGLVSWVDELLITESLLLAAEIGSWP